MTDLLEPLFKITIVLFMVGNLLELGLRLNLKEAFAGLRDARFVTLSLLWAFVLCPALAYLITVVFPLTQPYANGMLLLGLAPCAPLLPMMVDKARGDVNYAGTFMLLASAGTVIFMPIAVPLLVQGLTVSAWTVAKPMLTLVLIPLVIGIAIQLRWPSIAASIQPFVKKATLVDTLLMLLLEVILYLKGFMTALGTWAIGAQVAFFAVTIVASYVFAFGMPKRQRSVVTLGLSTRNVGAAIAPVFVATGTDPALTVMVTLGIPMMVLSSVIAARVFAGRAGPAAAPVPHAT